MKNNVSISYVLIVTLITSLLVLLLVVINVKGPILKKDVKETTTKKTTTTTKVIVKEDGKDDTIEITDSVMIEGDKVEFKAIVYKSNLGFQINYDKEYFKVKESNDNVLFENVYNKNNYVKVEKINKEKYLKEIEHDDKNPCEENGYTYTYKYFNEDDKYFLVTESLISDTEYDGLGIRMDYMVNSLQIDK